MTRKPHACRRCLTDKPHTVCPGYWWTCLDCGLLIGGYAGQILRAVETHARTGCRAVGRAERC